MSRGSSQVKKARKNLVSLEGYKISPSRGARKAFYLSCVVLLEKGGQAFYEPSRVKIESLGIPRGIKIAPKSQKTRY